jgi:voltage-gated sodium channel
MTAADHADLRTRLGAWIESPLPRNTIIALIVLNAVTLGLETYSAVMEHIGPLLRALERFIVTVFVLELTVKLIAFGPRFFRSGWNVFDLLVVGVSLVPAAGPFAVLRSLRVLRVLRLVSSMGRLRIVVESLLRAIPSIGGVGLLLGLVFYVFAVMGTMLFGAVFPDWFGSLGRSLYTLFQVMTLESWSMGIARPVMERFPYAWAYFIPFILVTTFTVLNLFIGIIVNTMQSLHAEEEKRLQALEDQAHEERETLLVQVRAVREQMARLERRLSERARQEEER